MKKGIKIPSVILVATILCCLPIVAYPLFVLCCGILSLLGEVFDMTYKEICVIVNIYVQVGLWAASSILPIIAATRAVIVKRNLWHTIVLFLTIVLGALYGTAAVWLVQRYALPLEESFDLCVEDLNAIASLMGTTYEIVNILIFVVFFVLCILGNYWLFRLINRKCRRVSP